MTSPSGLSTSSDDVEPLRAWVLAATDLVKAVNVERPVSALLNKVAAQARGLLGLDMCGVFLTKEATGQLWVHGSAGLSQQYIDRIHDETPLLVSPPRGEGLSPSVQAYTTGRTVAIPDVSSSTEMGPWRQHALQEGYQALIATPLRDGETIAGVIVGYSLHRRPFPRNQMDMLDLFAVQAGTALQAARLRDSSRAMIDELNAANAELRRQRHSLEVLDHQHRRLMQVLGNDVGAAGVVTMLSELLEASVTLEEPHGHVLASASRGTYLSPPRGSERKSESVAKALEQIRAKRAGSVKVERSNASAPPFWVSPVTLHNEVVAFLWVGGSALDLDDMGRLGLERFALAVALELSKQRNAVQVRLRLSRDLMTDLLSDVKDSDKESLVERASVMGHDLRAPHVLVVLRPDGRHVAAGRHTLQEVADNAMRQAIPGSIVGEKNGEVVVLVPSDAATGEGAVKAIVAAYQRRNEGRTVTAVIGTHVKDLTGIAASYRSARGALRLIGASKPGSTIDISALGVAALLLSHGDPRALRAFADETLSSIDEHESKGGAELIQTLRTWLNNDCSTGRTAEQLVVHANTVAYRLRKAEELLGKSLRAPAALVDLNMAFMIRDVLEETSPV